MKEKKKLRDRNALLQILISLIGAVGFFSAVCFLGKLLGSNAYVHLPIWADLLLLVVSGTVLYLIHKKVKDIRIILNS